MNEITNQKVAMHNDLIMSVAKMDKTPLKIFELAVASLDTKNIPKDRKVYVSKDLLFSFFNVKSENKHTRFKEAILKVHEQAIFSMRTMNERKKKYEYRIISPLEETSWNDYEDSVSFKFTESIMPYIIELKENFTQYLLSDIAYLNSKHSIIIFKLISMYYNQYEYYKYKNKRREKQLEDYRNPIITVEDLRSLTETENELSRFFDFEKRVLKQAEKEISENTTFTMTYEKIKKGRSVEAIQFHVQMKENWRIENYKIGDKQAVLTEEEKAIKNQVSFAESVASPYTMKLINTPLIYAADITNQDIMIGLNEHVYPIYDNLVKELGSDALDTHLSYVKNKMVDYSTEKKNIVKYLSVAATQYLSSRLSIKQMKKGG
ncbi:RepB [Lactococcus lactis subsp. lactis]|uniref:RepB family plasmid replication initiator protein n=1 Tax=Lactococcus lactis TaxID=1358 RepID=UPI00071D9AFE|nr:RepB family plasmid replication initiator protein [Lactococcus lactis]KST87998.1 RepB [Lactococcus lactis subsp. lactis]